MKKVAALLLSLFVVGSVMCGANVTYKADGPLKIFRIK